jgi:hypothetical protein
MIFDQFASSQNRHKPFANLIESGELQLGASNRSEATTIARHIALLSATFIRFLLNRKLIRLGASFTDELVIE